MDQNKNQQEQIKQYFTRVFHWNLNEVIEVSENESTAIDNYCNENCNENFDKNKKIHIVWRTTLLIAAIPLSIAAAILASIEVSGTFDYYSLQEKNYNLDFNFLTDVGYASFISNGALSSSMMVLSLCSALWYRFDVAKSATILRWTFKIVKLWPALIQNDA